MVGKVKLVQVDRTTGKRGKGAEMDSWIGERAMKSRSDGWKRFPDK
jgi:hypothetical protein